MLIKPNFKDKIVICIASGPSLTEEDCNLARVSGYPTIVTNTTYKMCTWADILFGYDAKWWMMYIEDVKKRFKGKLISYSHSVKHLGVECASNTHWFRNFQHSGACAIGLAIECGARKVILLGYDCKVSDKSHWHGEHPIGLTNCKSLHNWHIHLDEVRKFAEQKNCKVVNASPDTAIKHFEKVNLEEALNES
jgi:hypothetical protein